jgi:hypothetical protein
VACKRKGRTASQCCSAEPPTLKKRKPGDKDRKGGGSTGGSDLSGKISLAGIIENVAP